ncbi:MAG: AAA family ATPase [Bacteroidota bacterium]
MVGEDVRFNPFPGLRPFEEDEDYLFFGREKQIDELLTKLRTTRFLAVVGTSGSGKSSLVKCGLLPGLYGGFMAGTSSSWRIATFRPGSSPMLNLAEALAMPNVLYDHLDPEDSDSIQMHTAMLAATLNRSKRGIVDAVAEARLPADENLLLVVDQFEELFRFNREERSQANEERKSHAFVKLLLDAAEQREQNIFIVITMRSDFLGDCTQFRGLPEAINDGQYLIPRMTREEMKDAITGPVAVGGSDISTILLTRLLNDVGDRMDQLPVLQHALMRTWEKWEHDHEDDEGLDLRHYEAIGTMEEALSQHADEIYDELKSDALRADCELIFKAITEKSEGGRGIRRPTRISELVEITGVSIKNIVKIADAFRQHGRRFLMPPPDEPLYEDTILDISHESLMRVWRRCIAWVDEEMISSERYRDLAERAEKWHSYGQVGFLQDPELQLMINWRESTNPTEAWARRFRELQFETAMVYLRVSEERRAQLRERERRERRRKLILASLFAVILAIFSVISISLYFKAHRDHLRAEAANRDLEVARNEAVQSAQQAEEEKDRADAEAQKAEEQRLLAVARERDARAAELEAKGQRAQAILERQKADSLRVKADSLRDQADLAKRRAEFSAMRSEIAERVANSELEKTLRQQKLSEASSSGGDANRLLNEGKTEEGALLALVAYDSNQAYEGPELNEDIYPALDRAWREMSSTDVYEFVMSSYDVRVVSYNDPREYLASADNGGMVQMHTLGNEMIERSRVIIGEPVRSMTWAPDGGQLFVGLRNGQILSITTPALEQNKEIDLSRRVRQTATASSPVIGLTTIKIDGQAYLISLRNKQLNFHNLADPSISIGSWVPDSGNPDFKSLAVYEGKIYIGDGPALQRLVPSVSPDGGVTLEQDGSLIIDEDQLEITQLSLQNGHLAIGANTGTIWLISEDELDSQNPTPQSFTSSRYRFHQAPITSGFTPSSSDQYSCGHRRTV